MTVFKGYLKIIRRNLAYMLGFFGIFTAICLMAAHFSGRSLENSFQPESLAIAVTDQDDSALSRSLTQMLSRDNQVTVSSLDKAALTEALYIRSIQYVLVIPQNFQEDFSGKGGTLQVTAVPGSTEGYYLNSQIDAFLNQIRVYQSAGFSVEQAADRVLELTERPASIHLLDTGKTSINTYALMFQYLPYMYLAVLIYSVSYILKAFRNPEIRLRMNVSPVSPSRQFLQGSAAFLLLFLAFWVCSMVLPLFFGGLDFYFDSRLPWYLANTLLLLADSASLAFLVGAVIRGDNAINAMSNILGLGCSFLCGVFVPLEFLGENVRQFSRFLPFYWYEVINQELGTHTAMTSSAYSAITQGFLIQIFFALAFFCLTLAVNKKTLRRA